jgi:hypothetical protein
VRIRRITVAATTPAVAGCSSGPPERRLAPDELIAIRDLGGFTGSYSAGLGGTAKVTIAGGTYAITGTADGFKHRQPQLPDLRRVRDQSIALASPAIAHDHEFAILW